MDILTAFVSGFGRFVALPITLLNMILSSYFLIVFVGGLILFVANTPQEDLFAIYDAFSAVVSGNNGSFGTVIDTIVTASGHFAENVQHNFDPATLSAAVSNGVSKIVGVFSSGSL